MLSIVTFYHDVFWSKDLRVVRTTYAVHRTISSWNDQSSKQLIQCVFPNQLDVQGAGAYSYARPISQRLNREK